MSNDADASRAVGDPEGSGTRPEPLDVDIPEFDFVEEGDT
jgi:hypothetical protein